MTRRPAVADVRVRRIPRRWRLLVLATSIGVALSGLLMVAPAPADELACTQPQWPGTPGTTTDVRLTTLGTWSLSGCHGACTGASPEARVQLTPNASLQNVGSADIPWNDWIDAAFSTPLPPYDNRQHPLLTWNLYRIDGSGRIDQIGRAGVKHAWFSTNGSCGCNGGYVLWSAPSSNTQIGCTDTYTAANNSINRRLGPRSEIIPKDAIWGRCGSLWDPQCLGVASDHGLGAPAHRLLARESDLAPALNPDAQYYLEAWYLIRDEDHPNDNLRHVRGRATWSGSAWSNFVHEGAQVEGPAIDTWASLPIAAGGAALATTLATAEGRVRVASRATALGGGLYRYDYAVMNLDFARAATSGAEPNLRVLRNHGFDRIAVPVANADALTALEAVDGAGQVTPWLTNAVGTEVEFSASAFDGTLDWGMLMRFSFVAPGPPEPGEITLGVQDAGTPGEFAVAAVVPRALFSDGFED